MILRGLILLRSSRPLFNQFHTSSPKKIHPLLIALAKPVSRIFSIFLGRSARKVWRKLPQEKKERIKAKAKQNGKILGLGSLAATLGLTAVGYVTHLEESQISGRKRFLALKKDQIERISKFEFEGLLDQHAEAIVPESDPSYDRVASVATRILKSNLDIAEVKQKDWTITVIDSEEQNAFVLPCGKIFVYTGMLNMCSTNDELGIVLGHEIAHALLEHSAEMLSYLNLFNALLILPLAVLWAFIPSDGIAIVTSWFFDKVATILIDMPFNRQMETEADEIGLKLAAKSCFDVRQAPVFWAKMQFVNEAKEDIEVPEFLSTHPSHESREKNLSALMPETLKYRQECGCAKLTDLDPYQYFQRFKMAMKEEMAKKKAIEEEMAKKKIRVIYVA